MLTVFGGTLCYEYETQLPTLGYITQAIAMINSNHISVSQLKYFV